MRRVRRIFVFLLLATVWASARVSAAGTAELLRDINQAEGDRFDGPGAGGPLVAVGDRVVFTGYEWSSGPELWGSDGTAVGTRLLREAVQGPESARFRLLGSVRRGAIFLVSYGFEEDYELWRSNGTSEGTLPFIDQQGGGPLKCFNEPETATLGDNLLLFTATRSSGCGVWKTDGTAAGTAPVLEAEIGRGDPRELTAAGNRVFFFVGSSLWVSDGTAAGTVLLRAFNFYPHEPRQLRASGSRVFFIAQEREEEDEELWTSDGTPAGTRAVTDFFEPSPFSEVSTSILRAIDGLLYFIASDGTGFDLWRTDGTAAGTRRVTDFVSTVPFEDFDGSELVRLGNRLIFPANEGNAGWRLWSSGGTPETTALIEGCAGGCPSTYSAQLVRLGNRIVFTGYDPAQGTHLWVTDGTGAGTRRLSNVCPGFCDGGPPPLVPLLGQVFYIGSGAGGRALWKTDGTLQGTVRLADVPLPSGSFENPFAPVEAGGRIFFLGGLGGRGRQLWSSDGSPAGTAPVTVIAGSALGSSPFGLTPFAGGVLFIAQAGELWDREGASLWRTDGTTAGTQPIPGTNRAHPPVVAGGLAFFQKPVPGGDVPLTVWRTDGTAAGTFQVTPDGLAPWSPPVPLGAQVVFPVETDQGEVVLWGSDGTISGTRPLFELGFYPSFLRSLGGRLFFLGLSGDTNPYPQLFVSDGTAAGTRALTDFHGYVFGESHLPPAMARVGGTVYFVAESRLWKTDGTPAGTSPVLPAGQEGSSPESLVDFQGSLFFMGGTAQSPTGRGLWRSDGTAAGTFLVRPMGPPSNPVNGRPEPGWLTAVGNRLFFAAADGAHGTELWSSDGTTAGTLMVRDVFPGGASSQPSQLAAAAGRLYFKAADGVSGFELWESDGTTPGTRRVQDVAPGPLPSNPRDLTVAGNRLVFVADDGIHGEEPWVLPLTGGGCTPSADSLCLGGRFRVQADWRDFQGNRGTGTAVALTADTGYFWFFDAANVEVILKVLDGRGLNDHHWVFYGALSSVEYTLTVTDTVTGTVKTYTNPSGRLGSVADTGAF